MIKHEKAIKVQRFHPLPSGDLYVQSRREFHLSKTLKMWTCSKTKTEIISVINSFLDLLISATEHVFQVKSFTDSPNIQELLDIFLNCWQFTLPLAQFKFLWRPRSIFREFQCLSELGQNDDSWFNIDILTSRLFTWF